MLKNFKNLKIYKSAGILKKDPKPFWIKVLNIKTIIWKVETQKIKILKVTDPLKLVKYLSIQLTILFDELHFFISVQQYTTFIHDFANLKNSFITKMSFRYVFHCMTE